MAQITIKLRFNRNTGKKDILVEYESEADETPHEHEKKHRRIVEDLIEKGALSERELGEVVRVRKEGVTAPASSGAAETREAEGNKS